MFVHHCVTLLFARLFVFCIVFPARNFTALKDAISQLDQQRPQSPALRNTGTENAISDVYEINCTNLLVKSIYNEKRGWPITRSSANNSSAKFDDFNILCTIGDGKSKSLTPDFYAEVDVGQKTANFAGCLVALLCNQPPSLVSSSDLATPPLTPTNTPTKNENKCTQEKKVILFEYSVDESKWQNKLEQMEKYLQYVMKSAHKKVSTSSFTRITDFVCMAGLAFPAHYKFYAIKQCLDKKDKRFPLCSALHVDGAFFFLLCNETFVNSVHTHVSSNSRELKELKQLVLLMAKTFVGATEEK